MSGHRIKGRCRTRRHQAPTPSCSSRGVFSPETCRGALVQGCISAPQRPCRRPRSQPPRGPSRRPSPPAARSRRTGPADEVGEHRLHDGLVLGRAVLQPDRELLPIGGDRESDDDPGADSPRLRKRSVARSRRVASPSGGRLVGGPPRRAKIGAADTDGPTFAVVSGADSVCMSGRN